MVVAKESGKKAATTRVGFASNHDDDASRLKPYDTGRQEYFNALREGLAKSPKGKSASKKSASKKSASKKSASKKSASKKSSSKKSSSKKRASSKKSASPKKSARKGSKENPYETKPENIGDWRGYNTLAKKRRLNNNFDPIQVTLKTGDIVYVDPKAFTTLEKGEIVKNKHGKPVSKKKHKSGKANPWTNFLQEVTNSPEGKKAKKTKVWKGGIKTYDGVQYDFDVLKTGLLVPNRL